MKNNLNSHIIVIIALVAIVVVGFVAGLVAGSAAASKRGNVLSGDGWLVYSRKDRKAYVELDCNPTTGFDWFVGEVPEGLELVSSKYASSDKSGQGVGGGGTTTIVLKAKSAGHSSVDLVYRRNWEGGETGRVLKLQVDVMGSSKGRLVINGLKMTEE